MNSNNTSSPRPLDSTGTPSAPMLTEANPHINNPDGLPVIQPLPEKRTNPDGAVAICGECGLRIHPVMMYVCGNVRCPTGLAGARFAI